MLLALLASYVTVVSGVVLLAFWHEPDRVDRDPRSIRIGMLHIALAAAGVILWTVFTIGGGRTIRNASLALLASAAAAGATTLLSSRRRERRPDHAAGPGPVPTVVLAVHGVLALVTLVSAAVAVL